MKIKARDPKDARWCELEVEGHLITGAHADEGPAAIRPDDLWVAPAFWDIQTNGRSGHSFSSPELTIDQVISVVAAQTALGTARLCPTLITAPVDHMLHGLHTIAAACDSDPLVARRIVGIHLEGPFLSEREGYRGAHPLEAIRDPDEALFEKFQSAAGGRIRLVTLAPERPRAIEFIEWASSQGITIAIGHTAADGAMISAAIAAGARLSTHLGNGIASSLARHPNPIWEQAAHVELTASFIADGHHLDLATLRVLARAKGPRRTILVSDASPLAGLAPGIYGEWAVDPSGKIVVAGTPYLAGSNQGLEIGLRNLRRATGWSLAQCLATVTINPARLLGEPLPRLAIGEPADLVTFKLGENGEFALVDCYSSEI
jgi:N-acetylglucosamine-6-phosphate deacetylase